MSFGFSISDFISLTQLARDVYKRCRDARGEYRDISRDVESLYLVLRKVKDEAERPDSLLNRQESPQELNKLVGNCEEVLKQLNALVKKYGTLQKERPGVWTRLRIPKGPDLAELRGKLTAQTAAISIFLDTLGLGGIGRTEGKVDDIGTQLPEIKDAINKMAAEMRAGRREGSVMTTRTDDDKVVWREFRRELIDEGYSDKVIRRFKESIKAYIKNLAAQGLLDEEAVDSDSPSSSDGESQPFTCTGCSATIGACKCDDSIKGKGCQPSVQEFTGSEFQSSTKRSSSKRSDMADPALAENPETGKSVRVGSTNESLQMFLEGLQIVDNILERCNHKMPTVLSLIDSLYALRTAWRYGNSTWGLADNVVIDQDPILMAKLQELFQKLCTVLLKVDAFANTYESLKKDEERLNWSVSSAMEELAGQVLTCTNELHVFWLHPDIQYLYNLPPTQRGLGSCPECGGYRLFNVTCKETDCHCRRRSSCLCASRFSYPHLYIEYKKLSPCDPTFFPSQRWMWDDRMEKGWEIRRVPPDYVFYIDPLAQREENMCFWRPPIEELDPSRPLPSGWERIQGLTGQIRYRDNATGLKCYSHPSDNPRLATNPSLHQEELKAISAKAPCQLARTIWRYPHIRKAIADNMFPELTDLEDIKQAIEDHWQTRARSRGIWFWDGPLFKKFYHLSPTQLKSLHSRGDLYK